MLSSVLLLGLGLVILIGAGEALVRGASSLARLANVPTLVIGLTVVAFGTSAPELVVTVQAVTGGVSGIAMGNIIGSNIANILLVLGLPAIIAPVSMTVPKLRRHGVALALATLVFAGMVFRSSQVGTTEAIVFAVCMLLYFSLMLHEARTGSADIMQELEDLAPAKPSLLPTLGLTAVGLVGLPLGADLLVDNGSQLARMLGVSEEVIGLTVVAFGTSLPELATVLMAAVRNNASVSAGTIIGSNIFNMLFVGSAAGFVGTSTLSDRAISFDVPVMLAATTLICGLIFLRRDFGRGVGIVAVIGYVGYVVLTGTGGH